MFPLSRENIVLNQFIHSTCISGDLYSIYSPPSFRTATFINTTEAEAKCGDFADDIPEHVFLIEKFTNFK